MKKPNQKSKNHTLLSISLVLGAAAALFALIIEARIMTAFELAVIVPQFISLLACAGITLVAAVLFAGIVRMLFTFLDWSAVRTAINLAVHRLSFKIASKNAGSIYPCIQHFLYFVLSQNREFLRLPLGKDATCLVPAGYVPAYRSGCVFYRFQLIAPEKPEMDISLLRQIIQSYIVAEIHNHGISGLPAVFLSKTIGTMPGLFLDRVYYDEGMRFIGFDVLFIDNENAAVYARNAVMRDAAPKQTAVEVTDADL